MGRNAKKKSEKKFAPKLKAVIKRRHATAKIREAKRERQERRALKSAGGDTKKGTDKRYRPEDDFDTGFESNTSGAARREEVADEHEHEALDFDDVSGSGSDTAGPAKSRHGKSAKEMSVDEFLEGGFDEMMNTDDDADGDDDEDEGELELSDDDEVYGAVRHEEELQTAGKATASVSAPGSKRAREGPVPAAKQHKTASGEASKHRADLERMREEDPEFYEFLQKHDRELLAFGAAGDDSDAGSGSEAEGDEAAAAAAKKAKKKARGKERVRVTAPVLQGWEEAVQKQRSMKALKRLVVAFRCAAHAGDEAEADSQRATKSLPFAVDDSDVFNRLMLFCLRTSHVLFDSMLGRSEKTPPTVLPDKARRWKGVQPLVKSYLTSLLKFLQQLTHPSMIAVVLRQIERLAPYFAVYPKLAKRALKMLLVHWSGQEHSVRVLAYLAIRRLAMATPFPFIEMCMKGLYLGYVRNAKFVNATTLPAITFWANCVADLYALDPTSAYQHAFVYIRQIAIHLRQALNTHTKDAFMAVYNWQVVNSVKLWAQFLVQQAAQQELRPLVYPLVQVVLGIMKVAPAARHLPLRLILARVLIELGRAAGVFVPVVPVLLDALDMAPLHRKPKPHPGRPHDLELILRVSDAELQTREFQERAVDAVVQLLAAFFAVHASHIAFPEMALPATVRLRKFTTQCRVPRIVKQVMQLVHKLEENSRYITSLRAAVDFAPRDLPAVSAFSQRAADAPLVAYAAQLKQAADAMRARLAQSEAAREARRSGGGAAGSDSDSDAEGSDLSGDDEDGDDDRDGRSDESESMSERDGAASDTDSSLPSDLDLKKPLKRADGKSKGRDQVRALEARAAELLGSDDEADIVSEYRLSDDDDEPDNDGAGAGKGRPRHKHGDKQAKPRKQDPSGSGTARGLADGKTAKSSGKPIGKVESSLAAAHKPVKNQKQQPQPQSQLKQPPKKMAAPMVGRKRGGSASSSDDDLGAEMDFTMMSGSESSS